MQSNNEKYLRITFKRKTESKTFVIILNEYLG